MKEIAVIGAGTMGAGIAQVAAVAGCNVQLIDVAAGAVERGMEGIRKQLARLVGKGKLPAAERDAALARVRPADVIGNLAEVELAVEAVVEDLAVKRTVFAALERTAPRAILATNTSSLSVAAIAEGCADPSRVIGLHFFNPAPVMPLVEVVAATRSNPAGVDAAYAACKAWGKTPVRAKDTPGFIVNRVARGYYLESLRLLGEGVAGVDDIDAIMKERGGFKMGPFELMDLVGLDVNYAVSESVWRQMRMKTRFTPHGIQKRLVEAGHLGRKTGRGFYDYTLDKPAVAYAVERQPFTCGPELQAAIEAFAAAAGVKDASLGEQYVFARVLVAILNEAAFALAEGVATAEDIDTAMKLGTNYPKGPCAWAREIGHERVRVLLAALNASVPDGRFEAAKYG